LQELDYASAGITSVIWSMGFGTDYRWIEIPLFDGRGYPSHSRGITAVPGIYFLGLPVAIHLGQWPLFPAWHKNARHLGGGRCRPSSGGTAGG